MIYKNHIFFCTNQRPEGHARGSCAGRGAMPLRQYMASRLKELGVPLSRVNNAGCMDQCEAGPVMVVYPEGVWYSPSSEADVEEIIQQHILGGRTVERLRLAKPT